jgi:hypothetical protein
MPEKPRCPCGMYSDKGTCYHTGYKPDFKGNLFDRITAAGDRALKRWNEEAKKNNQPNQP